MALSFTGATGTTSATIPTHAAGDLILCFAYRDGNTGAPTIPSGQNWSTVHNATGANSNSHVLVAKFATSASETTGTFTNATSTVAVVVKTDLASGVVGYKGGASGSGSSTTLSFTGFTLDNPYSSSRIALFAGHRSTNTTTDTAPANYTNITSVNDATDEAAAHSGNNIVSTLSTFTQSVGGTSSGWRTHTVEVWESSQISATVQQLELSTHQATISLDVEISAAVEQLQLQSYPASIDLVISVDATVEQLQLETHQAIVTLDVNVEASTEHLQIETHSADVSLDINLQASVEQLQIETFAADISLNSQIEATTQALQLTTLPANVSLNIEVLAQTQALQLTTHNASVSLDIEIQAAVEQLQIQTFPASVQLGTEILATPQLLELRTYPASVLFEIAHGKIPTARPSYRSAELRSLVNVVDPGPHFNDQYEFKARTIRVRHEPNR